MNKIRSMDTNSNAHDSSVQLVAKRTPKNTVVAVAAAAVLTPEIGILGKNRASPPSPLKTYSSRPSPPNRSLIRVAVASRLMASYWHEHGLNLKGSSVMGCGRWKNYGSDPNLAEIEIVGEKQRMVGHFFCKSVWSCEHCAKTRVAQTRSWLRAELMPALDAHGLSASLLTFTLSHRYGDDWTKVTSALFRAYTLMDRRLAKVFKKAGSVGKLKSLEATVGKNGLHPHFHVLLTHAKDADLEVLSVQVDAAWVKAVAEVGGHCNERGFDFKPNCVNDYVAKLESAHELAAHSTKSARRKGKTLAQLLDAAAVGDTQSGDEWLRAQEALGGRMRFHAGVLPKKLGITCPSKWDDEERAEKLMAEQEGMPEPIRITYPQHLHLKATGTTTDRAGLAIILRSARSGDAAKVLRTVEALCAHVDEVEQARRDASKHRAVSIDRTFEVLQAAHQRLLTPEEVEIYLRARR